MIAFRIWWGVFLVLASAGKGQEISMPPKGSYTTTEIYRNFGPSLRRLNFAYNTPEAIRQELLDTKLSRLIAKFNGLSDEDLATFQIRQEYGGVTLYYFGGSNQAFSDRRFVVMSEQLKRYADAREAGHTRDFALSAITNKTDLSSISDPDLRAFLKERPSLPADRLKKWASGTYTNKAGEVASQTTTTTIRDGKIETTNLKEIPKDDVVGRWATYVLVDGEVASEYSVQFKPDGSVYRVMGESLRDAKEFDPKYTQTIKDAMDQAEAELKKEGITHRFGSVHVFWPRVTKILKEKGVDWHSPAEMNPKTRYD
jgi:hypothetical protein